MGETYYDVLGVDRDATQEEIAAAYRRRAFAVHPDRNDDPDATEQFARLSTAESVLSNERERARYDRLGHDGYVRLARLSNESPDESDREADAARAESSADAGERTPSDGPGADRSGRDRRQANRRERQRRRSAHWDSKRRSSGEDPFNRTTSRGGRADSGGRGAGRSGTSAASEPSGASESSSSPSGATDRDDGSTFRYAVHDWSGEIEIHPRTRRLDRHTALVVACLAVLYPVFVFASLEPAFPIPVNAFLAACTLVFVGYLLTMPTIALATFGCWGVLVPLALVELPPFEPLTLHGVLVVGFVWIPFGYALAVRWVVRP